MIDELTPRKAAPERPRTGKSSVPILTVNSDEVIEIDSDTEEDQRRAAVKKGKQKETKASSSNIKPRDVPSDAQITAPYRYVSHAHLSLTP